MKRTWDVQVLGVTVMGSKDKRASPISLMCIGILVFPLALFCLGRNEKMAVCESRMIDQAEYEAEEASCDDSASVEGKMAFYSCPIDRTSYMQFTPETSFNMPGLGESVKISSVAASQKVEMYQCIEEKTSSRRRQSKTSYSYRMGWAGQHYDSTQFQSTADTVASNGCPDFIYNGAVNNNPKPPSRGDGREVSLGTQTVRTSQLKTGAFTVSDEDAISHITPGNELSMRPFADQFTLQQGTDNVLSEVTTATVAVHAGQDSYLSSCRDQRLGCIRISYKDAQDTTHVSVIAKVGASGNVEPMVYDESWGCDKMKRVLIYTGEMTLVDMIHRLREEANLRKWLWRGLGLLGAWLAVWCCFEPISAATEQVGDILEKIPVFGDFLGGTLEGLASIALCVVSVTTGCGCGLLVITIVWLAMRPMYGAAAACVVLVLFGVAYLAVYRGERQFKGPRRFAPRLQAKQEAPPMPQYQYADPYSYNASPQGEQQPLMQQPYYYS